ncbi:MAG: formate--tetrahydrofolate ligase [Sedimentisphaerales bacterium]|nr:formate--tetrahydrofolate ligase [Sedimentisphaerales bacterium]
MKLDPMKMKNWEIAESAEKNLKSIFQLAGEIGLKEDEILPVGHDLGKVNFMKVLGRLKDGPPSKYIDVTAITPTPFGEGKTTTTIGLIQGLGKCGKIAAGAIRQPSAGPTFNIKGGAAGGGLSQCVPLVPFSIRLTGDIDSVTNAHNLCMTALTARMQHEKNYDDERLAKRNLRRLDIDPDSVQIGWAIDLCAQSLRNIRIGLGGPKNGVEISSGFQITVSSEVMAILAITKSIKDFRRRIAKMVVAKDRKGNDITTADLEVDGAMTAWMVGALNPNLLQTIEGQPVFVHAGPFANIAIGQSSVIADLIATKLSEYHVTESGFGTDIGYEKFWNLKCRISGLRPDAVVIVATVRALKMHGGGPPVRPGAALNEEYTKEHLDLLEKGCENLVAHIDIVRKSGIKPIVCINSFYTDTKAEHKLIKKIAEQNGAIALTSEHWLKGGVGAIELAEAVIDACKHKNNFKFLYDIDMPLRKRIELIAKKVYGANGVSYSETALEKIKGIETDPVMQKYGTCMAKTHLSLSYDPEFKGRPIGWQLPIRDVLVYKGAEFVVPLAGEIKLMPGTSSDPAFRRIDVDVETGKVRGLF